MRYCLFTTSPHAHDTEMPRVLFQTMNMCPDVCISVDNEKYYCHKVGTVSYQVILQFMTENHLFTRFSYVGGVNIFGLF